MTVRTTSGGWEVATENGWVTGRAQFSDDGTRRYVLIRRWAHTIGDDDERTMPLTWVMLNPSSAGAADDDPTIRKCVGYAKRWGYGGIRVLNLFDYIATDPHDLARQATRSSPANDQVWEEWLLPWNRQEWTALEVRPDVVVGWGDHGSIDNRDQWAARMFIRAGIEPSCLGVTRAGQPLHPGRTSYDLQRVPWKVL